MAYSESVDIAVLERSFTPRSVVRFTAGAGVLALGSLLAVSPASSQRTATSPAACKFAPISRMDREVGVEPQLLINGTCVDPVYNENTFVITKTEQLTYQVAGGPLIPFTEVTGHFPATNTLATLPPPVLQSPTVTQQNYILRFPAKEYWKNRSFEQQHPTGGGVVDNRMAFTNGAFSVNWMSASIPNAVASTRHQAAATKVARAYANKLYGNSAKIYSYLWGCSGGGVVAMAAAENVTGIWDGVQVQCMGAVGIGNYHSFEWAEHYTLAVPQAKRDAVAAAAVPGGTGDIYAGLNEEEKSVLNEYLSAGFPIPFLSSRGGGFISPVDPIDIRMADPTYEDDFWSKPGYAGSNPPNYLKAGLVDGWATVTAITRDAAGAPTAVQFDPATVPKLTTTGDAYLEFYVYGPDGKTRLIDPKRSTGVATTNKPRYSLIGKLDPATGLLTLNNATPAGPNSPLLLGGLKVGAKVRVNNRFLLSTFYYPRHSNLPGARSHDQYRNADGSPKYPQRKDISVLAWGQYRTMGGRTETGAIKTRTMVIEGRGDSASWPIFNSSYSEAIRRTLGSRANDMTRFYLHDNGRHAVGGGEPGIFQQSIQDLMAWAERGIAPPPSTAYTVRSGQVVPPDNAADRGGLQPVMSLTVNDVTRATARVNQPVTFASRIEMPPKTGQVVQYGWTISAPGGSAAPPAPARGGRGAPPTPPPPFDGIVVPPTVLEKPQPLVNVNRTMSFDKPGTYVVRLTVSGQRDGLVNPPNQTLLQNWKEVRVVVQ